MPSCSRVAHAGTSFGVFWTPTRQRRQEPTTGSFGYQQSVGTSISAARAASRIVAPVSTVTVRPSIVSVVIGSVQPSPVVDRAQNPTEKVLRVGMIPIYSRSNGLQTLHGETGWQYRVVSPSAPIPPR